MQPNTIEWSDNIIEDGFTQDGFVQSVEGLHGEMRFRFRPMLPEDVEVLEVMREREGERDPKAVRVKLAKEMAARITAWDQMLKSNAPAPVSETVIRRLKPALQAKMYNIIAGIRPTDLDPARAQNQNIEDELQPIESIAEQLGNS